MGGKNEIIQPIQNKKNLGDFYSINKEKVDFWQKKYEEYLTHKHCCVYCD